MVIFGEVVSKEALFRNDIYQ